MEAMDQSNPSKYPNYDPAKDEPITSEQLNEAMKCPEARQLLTDKLLDKKRYLMDMLKSIKSATSQEKTS
ncbi:unnamed protein product [Allacma fusca]|uniref:Uncharacterized protein n=1 Tax=Allacma fusca TaxID=39272 RepID=A0A8J2JMY7_9HEXA|nr:unnamed protein product [Allacma fusca]